MYKLHCTCRCTSIRKKLPVVEPKGDAVANPNTQTDKQWYYFQTGNTSVSWELNNVIIRAGQLRP